MLFDRNTNQFQSKKIQQNVMWSQFAFGHQNDGQYIGTIPSKNLQNAKSLDKKQIDLQKQPPQKQAKITDSQVWNLQDMWNALQEKKEIPKVRIQIQSIFDEPQTLTTEEMEQIFGQSPKKQSTIKIIQQSSIEEPENFQELWNMVDSPFQKQQKPVVCSTNTIQQQKIDTNSDSDKAPKTKCQYYEVQQKQSDSAGRTSLILGKNFLISDPYNFVTHFFQTSVFSYFGFQQVQPNRYNFYDLTTNEPLMYCSLEEYEYFQQDQQRRKIEYEKDYCLKFRLSKNDELVAAVWQKRISNGLLYNVRHFNIFEQRYEQSVALIEITDGYIGNNCYCNTNVFISQRWCGHPGQLKMKLSLKNGYLIANMGVAGIKSAPYNCRLQNSRSQFVYLLGLVEKDTERFIVRVGEGISPILTFAISIGRKRYIDSFKE